MSDTIDNLKRGKDLAWSSLQPAFDHAIALAREAEFIAGRASDLAMTAISPAYPPLVEMLANAGQPPSDAAIAKLRARLTEAGAR